MEKKQIEYNNLLEEKEELTEVGEWLEEFKKKTIKAEKISFIICTLMTVPFLAYGFCLLPEVLAPLNIIIPLVIFGGTGILITGAFTIIFNPILSLMKFINKLSIKNNNQKISTIEKQKPSLITQGKKKTTNKPITNIKKTTPTVTPKYSYKPTTDIKKQPKSSTVPPKYSYKPTNKDNEFDPKKHIKIINGKMTWVDNPETISNPKKRTLSK